MRGSFRAHPTAPSPADAHAGISPVFLKLLADEPLEGRTVLDVGTGRGRLALTLAPRCGRVVGIDRSEGRGSGDRKSTRLNSSHTVISYAVFCLKKKKRRPQRRKKRTAHVVP